MHFTSIYYTNDIWFSVAKSCLTLQSHGRQLTKLPCPLLSPGVCSNSCPFSQWCYLAISFSAASFCPYSSQASGSFPMSWLFLSVGESMGTLASALVLPMNSQDRFPLELSDLIFLQSNGLSRVLFRATVWLFDAQNLLTHSLFRWSLRPYIISRHSDFICGSFRNWSSILKFMFCMPEISKTPLTY